MDRAAPQQQRSRETVERILIAANAEIAARGTAAVTTTQIAARAGVSVGALYRFFADKHAIADALAQRYLEAATDRYLPLLDDVGSVDQVPDMVRAVVRASASLQAEHPAYFRMTEEIGPDRADSVGREVRAAMVDGFDGFMARLAPEVDAARRRTAVWMVVETLRHVLATGPAASGDREILVEELEEMVVVYVASRLGLR